MQITPEKYAVQFLEIITRSSEAISAGLLVKEAGSHSSIRMARRSGQKSYELLTVTNLASWSTRSLDLDYESDWYDGAGPRIVVKISLMEGEEGWAELNALWTMLET